MKSSGSKFFAFVASFFSILGFIFALLFVRKDKYVMFYAKQSLVLFVVSVLVGIINSGLAFIPILGGIIRFALGIFVFILWLELWIYALSGKAIEVVLIGKYARKIGL